MKKKLSGEIDVLLDGGIRRGADVIKALCLGAKGVLIGRAYAYGNMAYNSYFVPNPQLPGKDFAFAVTPVDYSKGQYRFLNPTSVEFPGHY